MTNDALLQYIRYIYNRVILEEAPVRAAAVSALAKFGTKCEDLRPSIVTLLSRCKYDADDEVRDRATMYLDLLTKDPVGAKKLVLDSMKTVAV
jgi:coatomer protein complex subunit gamma